MVKAFYVRCAGVTADAALRGKGDPIFYISRQWWGDGLDFLCSM